MVRTWRASTPLQGIWTTAKGQIQRAMEYNYLIYTLEINSDKSVKDAKQMEDKATCRS